MAPLKEGFHRFVLLVRDKQGNFTSLERSFAVDTTPPDPPILRVPSITRNAILRFEGSSEPHAQVFVFVDDVVRGMTVAGLDGSWKLRVIEENEGVKRVQTQSKDRAEDVSQLSEISLVVLDQSAPLLQLINPISGVPHGNRQPRFVGSAEDALSGVDWSEFVLDGRPFSPEYDERGGTFFYDPPEAFEVPSVLVALRVADFAGNIAEMEGEVSFAVLEDVTSPRIVSVRANGVLMGQGEKVFVSSPDLLLHVVVADDMAVGEVIASFDGEELTVPLEKNSESVSIKKLVRGEHVLFIQVKDQKGNVSPVYETSVVVDLSTSPPFFDPLPSVTSRREWVVSGSGIEPGARMVLLLNDVPVPVSIHDMEFLPHPLLILREGVNFLKAQVTGPCRQ